MNEKSVKKKMSRMKRKLLLYFILIAVVSISVSAEIILELSSPLFHDKLFTSIEKQVAKTLSQTELEHFKENYSRKEIAITISNLRNRMILLLLVISGCIISAFFFFTKDIVSPMDDMVKATKQIASGDLTVSVPVVSEDEIGQIGLLINNMNKKLLDMIIQVKRDISRHRDKIHAASKMIEELVDEEYVSKVIESKRITKSDFVNMVNLGKNVINLMDVMTMDLTTLHTFVNMYKTYSLKTELSQNEIEEALEDYSEGNLT